MKKSLERFAPPMKLSVEDKKLIRLIQGDLFLSRTPFEPLAQQLGWGEKELLQRVNDFRRLGLIRRFGAILRHQIAGYRGNAMVVWKVPEDQIVRIGRAMVSFAAVSHCYYRPSFPEWPFNLYTMVHGRSEEDCRLAARKISQAVGVKGYRLLFSQREHKKSSMRYFR